MERKQFIGILLIMVTFMLWTITSSPSKEELEKAKKEQDSLALLKVTKKSGPALKTQEDTIVKISESDTLIYQLNVLKFGSFAPSSSGSEKEEVLENELIRITFSNKGGRIKEALLKKHYKTVTDSAGKDSKELVKLLNAPENKFEYSLPVSGTSNNTVKSSDLYFTAEKAANTISFKAKTSNGGYFEQKYELSPDNYTLKYTINTKDLGSVLTSGTKSLPLYWENHLGKYEKGQQFEQSYSTVYFKESEERRDYCSCVSDDTKELNEKPIEWVSHVNQFFNTSLVGNTGTFSKATVSTKMTDIKSSSYVKIVTSDLQIPMTDVNQGTFDMT
ncbi:MAG: hypothetical protein RIR48_1761, partial [Bacteroidota bacterium]